MLSQKAMLVCLNISQWTARKKDKRATSNVEETFKTQNGVGQFTKKLLPGASELEAVSSQAGAIRKFFYEQTLPWCADGTRIISSKNYLDFVREFNAKKSVFESSVAAFIQEYPTLHAIARVQLGELFLESEYPGIQKLSESFECNVQFFPLPEVGDFRTEILDSEKEAFQKQMRDVETTATREVWTRLHAVVSKAADKLNQPDAIFRDTLLENISDLCTLLPKLNVNDDAELERARQDVEGIVSKLSPETCRVNPEARADAAKSLQDMTEKMRAFMGVN